MLWVALAINKSQKQIRPNDFRPNFLPHDLFLYSNDVTQKPWRKKNGPRRKKIVTARQVKNAAAAAADTARSRDVDGGAIRIFA